MAGVGGITLGGAGGCRHISRIAMLGRQNVYRIVALIIRHGQIQSNRALGGGNIAVLGKLCIHHVAADRLQDTVLIKPGHADTVGRASVGGICAKRSCPNAIPCLHREGNGPGRSRRGIAPAAHRVVNVLRLQRRPEVGAGTQVVGQALQMAVCIESGFRGDDQISGDLLDVDPAIRIAVIGDIHTTHGDADGQAVSRDDLLKGIAVSNALKVAKGGGCLGQLMCHGVHHMLPCLDLHIRE